MFVVVAAGVPPIFPHLDGDTELLPQTEGVGPCVPEQGGTMEGVLLRPTLITVVVGQGPVGVLAVA